MLFEHLLTQLSGVPRTSENNFAGVRCDSLPRFVLQLKAVLDARPDQSQTTYLVLDDVRGAGPAHPASCRRLRDTGYLGAEALRHRRCAPLNLTSRYLTLHRLNGSARYRVEFLMPFCGWTNWLVQFRPAQEASAPPAPFNHERGCIT